LSLFAELKRRNVFRVAIAYGVVAWVLAQVADLAFENFGAPDWVAKSVLFILALGFPLAVIFAWAFELTPDGIKREKDVDRDESITTQTGKKLNGLIIALPLVAVVVLLVERSFRAAAPPAEEVVATESADLSIAVLPFDNRSNREEDEFFTEGIHDDLLTTMANIGSMKVISRTSVMEYKDTTKKIPEIARELGVANILEGGVQRSGNHVRINVQLIDATTDEHLWAQTYDRELTAENLFKIQSEVSQSIAEALQATLSPDEAERINALPTTSLQAYEAYLRGRQRWEVRTADSTAQAVELFLNAIELDPNFAEAWAGLGDAYRHQVPYGGLPEYEVFPKAEEAINKSLELNPDLAEAHAALGGLTRQMGGDLDKSMYHLERAIELNPSYSPAYNWLGILYNELAQFDRAFETFSKGQQVDPLSAVLASNLAFAAGSMGRHDEMKRRLDRLAETHAESPFTYSGQAAYQFFVKGRHDEALSATLQAVLADPNDTQQRAFAAYHLDSLGDAAASSKWLDSAFALQPDSLEPSAILVLIEIENGRLDEAMAEAQQIAAQYGKISLGWGWIAELLNSADIDSGNPQAAIERYKDAYPQFWGESARPLSVVAADQGIEMVRLLQASGEADTADALLLEIIRVLEAAQVVGPGGSGFWLPSAYALAGRPDQATNALRTAIDAGYRVAWRYYFDYHWSFASLRDDPKFQSMRIALATDMQKQLENLRRMLENGEIPTVPGMELLSQPDKSGAPPI
jgi:TolB-like protein/predicted transcriptional regulator